MKWNDTKKWRCNVCAGISTQAKLLRAENPFLESDEINGCPHCRYVSGFVEICDEPGCERDACCGFPATPEYRRTCLCGVKPGEHTCAIANYAYSIHSYPPPTAHDTVGFIHRDHHHRADDPKHRGCRDSRWQPDFAAVTMNARVKLLFQTGNGAGEDRACSIKRCLSFSGIGRESGWCNIPPGKTINVSSLECRGPKEGRAYLKLAAFPIAETGSPQTAFGEWHATIEDGKCTIDGGPVACPGGCQPFLVITRMGDDPRDSSWDEVELSEVVFAS